MQQDCIFSHIQKGNEGTMFLKSNEYLRELYSIKVRLILYNIFVIFLPAPNNTVFTFIFPTLSVIYKRFVSVLQWLACLFSLPVFLCTTIPPVCGVCASLITWICEGTYDGKVWSFLSSCLRQKWKTTGWKDPLIMRFWDCSTVELLFISLPLWMVPENHVLSTSFSHMGFYI